MYSITVEPLDETITAREQVITAGYGGAGSDKFTIIGSWLQPIMIVQTIVIGGLSLLFMAPAG